MPRTSCLAILLISTATLWTGVPLFAGKADISTQRIAFEVALPLENVPLPAGPYLVSGKIFAAHMPVGSFYRIPRLLLPCKEPPCSAIVAAEVPMKNVTEDLVRSLIQQKCRLDFHATFKQAQTKTVQEANIRLDLTPKTIALAEESAESHIRIEGQSVTPKDGALTLDLVLENPFPFPLKLVSITLKVVPVPRSVYEKTFAFDEPLAPGETEKTLALPLKAADLLYLISHKIVQEDYSLKVTAGMEGTVRIEIAGEKVEIPFAAR
jgi:hypothetical protein